MIEAQDNVRLKQYVCLFILLFVNFVFLIKYLGRVTEYNLPISIAICSFYFSLWYFRKAYAKLKINFNAINYVLLIGFVTVSAFIFTMIDVNNLKVDRWSIITAFWENYFNGEYVYYAKSFAGWYPGPMPFYFVIALPFMLLGELGYFSLMGVVVLFYVFKWEKIKPAAITVFLLFIMLGCFYLWEVFSRSNILVNAALVLAVIIYFLKQKNFDSFKTRLIVAVLIGLVMSTRNVFVIPFIILFLYALKAKIFSFAQAFSIGAIALFIFAITFVPFVIGFWEDFLVMNPFLIQSSVLIPFSWSFSCILISAGFFLLCRRNLDVFFYSGLALFLTIIAHFAYQSIDHGLYGALFDSYADVGYFMLGMPFTLYYLFKVDAFSDSAIIK